MPRFIRAILPFFYLLVLIWLNVYVCREAFDTASTGHFNSMHGVWMALARLGDFSWSRASWWPWWGAGSPLEYTYAPLVPVITAFVSRLEHGRPDSLALAFNQLSAVVYCLAPVAMYVASWRISGSAAYSLAAAVACSLLSPIQWIVPDAAWHFRAFRDAREFMLVFSWDDLPHLLSISLVPLVVWLLHSRATNRRANVRSTVAGLLMALMMLSNMFGMVLVAFVVITLPLATDADRLRDRLRYFSRLVAIAICAWIAVSPWLTPSLLWRIHLNSVLDGEAASTLVSLESIAIVSLVVALLFTLTRRRIGHWGFRWLLLFGSVLLLLPVLQQYFGLRFLPQPGRYKIEANFLILWIAVFSAKPLLARIPCRALILILVPVIYFGERQIVTYRRYAKTSLGGADNAQSIEYEAAKWFDRHLPGQRVMMPGSPGQWADTFFNVPQVGGQPYTSAPNFNLNIASYIVSSGDGAGNQDAAISIFWLKALGARAIVVPGSRSPEYWHPFSNPRKFDGVLPVLWRERDTTAYEVATGPYSLGHVIRPADLVRDTPVNGIDVREIERYDAAIEHAGAPAAILTWEGANRASIDARIEPGEIVSAQITWDPGWHASVNGAARRVFRDGLGLIAIDPACAGTCVIRLEYDGGLERRACRIASGGLPILLLILFAGRRLRERPGSH